MSIQPTKLILAFMALATVCLAGRLMDYASLHMRPDLAVVIKPDSSGTELDEYVSHGLRMTGAFISLFRSGDNRAGVFQTLWSFGSAKFHLALTDLSRWDLPGVVENIGDCLVAPLWAITFHPVYSVIFFGISLIAVALAGGALCRIAALQFARGEKPGLIEALRFSAAKFNSFLTAPLIPVGIIVALGVFIAFLGLLGRVHYVGELSLGAFLPLALILAVPITIFLIGALAGFNLMFPSIAYEDSDGFDAVSRSFSYVYAQPWHMGFYTVIAFIYGAICYAFVRFFSLLLLYVTRIFLQVGFFGDNAKLERIWPQPLFGRFLGVADGVPIGWAERASAFLVEMWVLAVMGLMVSFVISFFFSANTIIYALMRKRVDKTSLAEVHTRSDEMAADRAAIEAETPEMPAEPEPKPEAQPGGPVETAD
jgi:hypothetical protein